MRKKSAKHSSRVNVLSALSAAVVIGFGGMAHADTGEAKVRINVRDGTSTDFPIVTTLSAGQAVEIVSRDGEFAKVRTAGGSEGYLKLKFLTVTETPVAVAPAPVNDNLQKAAAILAAQQVAEPTKPAAVKVSAEPESAVTLDAVTVTGSRILRKSLTSNSPIAVFEAQDLKFSNASNIEEFLRDMPQFVAAVGGNTNNGNPGVATLDLRNLGEERTLILVDGKRFMPYDADGIVDLSMIPVALIERVEVITGGASAVYGSDAVAGVVNFIMKKDFEGLEGDYAYQVTGENDGDRTDISVTMGGLFAEGRGNAVFNLGYTEQKAVTQGDRSFSFEALDDLLAPGGSFTTPWGSLIGSYPTVDTADEGLVQFDQNGNATLVPTLDVFNFNPFNLLQAPQKRWSATALTNLEISENVSAYGRLSLSNSRVNTIIAPTGTFFNPFQLNIDNPYLSQQARDVFAADDTDGDGLVDISFGRRLVELGTRDSLYENTGVQIVAGLEGTIADVAKWEIFGQMGRTTRVQNFVNDVNFDNTQQSLLAVTDSNGDIVCKDQSNGCVPGNYFGPGLLSAGAADFIRFNIQENNSTEQRVFGGSIAGPTNVFLPTASSPLAYAVGVEVRQERGSHRPDAAYEAGNAIGFGSSSTIQAKIDIQEVFGELSVPLTDSVTVEAGVRVAKYENTSVLGGTSVDNDFDNTSFKLMGEWQATDSLRLRTGFQRAVRAPNLSEIGQPQTPSTGDLDNDPCEGQNPVGDADLTALCVATGVPVAQIGSVRSIVSGQINNYVGGNPTLEPEEADSITAGFVFAKAGSPLSVSVDYFNIEITDAIEQITEQGLINTCYLQEKDAAGEFCALVHRNPLNGGLQGGTETGVDVSLRNTGTTTREGVEVAIDYGWNLGPGKLDVDFQFVHILKSTNQETALLPEKDCVGLLGNTCVRPDPENRFVQNTRWTQGPYSVNLRWQYLDELQQDAIVLDGKPASDYAVPTIDAFHYFDLSGSYQFGEAYTLRAGIYNLFDKAPPVTGNDYGGTAENSGNTFPATYDPLGRTFAVGINARF